MWQAAATSDPEGTARSPVRPQRPRAVRRGPPARPGRRGLQKASKLRRQRVTVSPHPIAGEIGLPVRRPRRRRVHDHTALRVARDVRLLIFGPLRRDRYGTGHHDADHAGNRVLHVSLSCGTKSGFPVGEEGKREKASARHHNKQGLSKPAARGGKKGEKKEEKRKKATRQEAKKKSRGPPRPPGRAGVVPPPPKWGQKAGATTARPPPPPTNPPPNRSISKGS